MEFSSFEIKSASRTGFSCFIENVKCDFYNWSVPFIEDELVIDGLRLGTPGDITGFKLDAVITRKEKKDFFDLYILLQRFTFSDILNFYKRKYVFNDIRVVMEGKPYQKLM